MTTIQRFHCIGVVLFQTMFHDLAPVMGGFGLKMLKKMGWKEGEPLGIHGQGFLVPLAVDVKMDRSGELNVSEQYV